MFLNPLKSRISRIYILRDLDFARRACYEVCSVKTRCDRHNGRRPVALGFLRRGAAASPVASRSSRSVVGPRKLGKLEKNGQRARILPVEWRSIPFEPKFPDSTRRVSDWAGRCKLRQRRLAKCDERNSFRGISYRAFPQPLVFLKKRRAVRFSPCWPHPRGPGAHPFASSIVAARGNRTLCGGLVSEEWFTNVRKQRTWHDDFAGAF